MRALVITILVAITIAGCASRPPVELPPPRITLEPSPNKDSRFEVLQSDRLSGAYIAFSWQVPVTRYFQVVGDANCEDWIYIRLMTPRDIRTLPNYYISPDFKEDKAAHQCASVMHKRYAAREEETLLRSDGVIFDADTARILNNGIWIGQYKMFIRGWAIKFVEPTAEEIALRLKTNPWSTIDHNQVKAAAYWVQKHPGRVSSDTVATTLNLDNWHDVEFWDETRLSVLKALALTHTKEDSAEPYRKILRAGLTNPRVRGVGEHRVIPLFGGLDAAVVAANVLACRGEEQDAALFYELLKWSQSTQHVNGAARGLVAMGKSKEIEAIFASAKLEIYPIFGTATQMVRDIVKKDPLPFKCPYKDARNA